MNAKTNQKYRGSLAGLCADGSQLSRPMTGGNEKVKRRGAASGPCDGSQLNKTVPHPYEKPGEASPEETGRLSPG
jgi:hypothetical protein